MKANNKVYLLFCIWFIFLSISCNHSAYTPPAYYGFDALDNGNNLIIFIGDTQGTSILEFWREDNKEKTPVLIRKIASQKPACVINLGDLIFCGTSQKQWKMFDKAHDPILKNKIPYFPVPGNHEYWCNPNKTFKNYFSRFPHLNNRKWYSFSFQMIGFLMLDSNFSRLNRAETHRQVEWYNDELSRLNNDPKINYIIVCCHNPPFTNSKVVKPDKKVRGYFVEPFFRLKKTAAFFSGHCHSYERFIRKGKYFIVTGGGGGPRQELEIEKEKRLFPDEFDGPAWRFLNFCQMSVEPDRLLIQVIKLTDGGKFEIAEEFTIQKSFSSPI